VGSGQGDAAYWDSIDVSGGPCGCHNAPASSGVECGWRMEYGCLKQILARVARGGGCADACGRGGGQGNGSRGSRRRSTTKSTTELPMRISSLRKLLGGGEIRSHGQIDEEGKKSWDKKGK